MTSALGIFGLALAVLFAGVLIGATGIGGVLLVPILAYLGDIPVHLAVTSCNFSYLFTGLVGAAFYARKGSISWGMGLWLGLGAMPGAYFGAYTLSILSTSAIEAIIAVLIVFSGIHAIVRGQNHKPARETLAPAVLAGIGVVVGIGSAVSGTGGPLVLVPILVWLELPVLVVIGLGQIVMVPIALLATAGNLVHGRIDFVLGGVLAAILMVGAYAGAEMSHRLPADLLKRAVAAILIGVGALILVRLGFAA
ncbi:MAG: sulfite exporter TauE/SafE family protein [Rhodospirillales bacterium]|nr:sulfite exporter TauE/SafE family protein [Rhodospirillales bacterium]MSP81035.1 sulfite exporter TauE/SafE family protein [Rhodospirillales bacterium]